ncbi:hypothetical protein L1049_021619 [Liquidambar formosana]|uniref:Uncharacterized protein n=1 Tax=Liquidambar formosana TaxID=63359 RepID=A0AAP0R242_LIQFO
MTRDPKPRPSWTVDLHDRFVDAVTKLGGPDCDSYLHHCAHSSGTSIISSRGSSEQGEIPHAEALRNQIEVQKKLQERLEAQILLHVGTKEVTDENRGTRELQCGARRIRSWNEQWWCVQDLMHEGGWFLFVFSSVFLTNYSCLVGEKMMETKRLLRRKHDLGFRSGGGPLGYDQYLLLILDSAFFSVVAIAAITHDVGEL